MTVNAFDADEALLGNANSLGVYVAPVGTAPPSSTVLDATWTTLGYAHEDGVKIKPERETESLMAWQSGTPIRVVTTAYNVSIEVSLLQHNALTLALYWGQPVPTPDANGDVRLPVNTNAQAQEHALIIDTRDGDIINRYYFPRAQVSEVGELEIVRGAFQALPVTFQALDPGNAVPAEQFRFLATAPVIP